MVCVLGRGGLRLWWWWGRWPWRFWEWLEEDENGNECMAKKRMSWVDNRKASSRLRKDRVRIDMVGREHGVGAVRRVKRQYLLYGA